MYLSVDDWKCGEILKLIHAAGPRLARYFEGLGKPRGILMRPSLHQQMQASTASMNWPMVITCQSCGQNSCVFSRPKMPSRAASLDEHWTEVIQTLPNAPLTQSRTEPLNTQIVVTRKTVSFNNLKAPHIHLFTQNNNMSRLAITLSEPLKRQIDNVEFWQKTSSPWPFNAWDSGGQACLACPKW